MSVTLRYRDLLDDGPQQEFEQLVAALNKRWNIDHLPSGAHGDMTVSSIAPNDTVNSLISWTGTKEWLKGAWYFDELIRDNDNAMLRPVQWAANQNNYNPPGLSTAFGMEVETDADRDLTGIFVHRLQKRLLLFGNRGNFVVTLKHNSSSSLQPNRIFGAGAADVVLSSGEYVWLYFDVGSKGWRVVGPI